MNTSPVTLSAIASNFCKAFCAAVSEKRLSLLSYSHVRYELKTPHRDETTHVIFEPLVFIAPNNRFNALPQRIHFSQHQRIILTQHGPLTAVAGNTTCHCFSSRQLAD